MNIIIIDFELDLEAILEANTMAVQLPGGLDGRRDTEVHEPLI